MNSENSPKESKLKQLGEGVADGAITETIEAAVEVGVNALAGAADVACDVAVECAGASVKFACEIAGSALDGL